MGDLHANLAGFCEFIERREALRKRRESGEPPPWTGDPVLLQFRFCNVRREDDRVTRWIAKNWRKPHEDAPHLWFAMLVARFFNDPETLDSIWCPHTRWRADSALEALRDRRAAGHRVFNPAYIVSTNGVSCDKLDYLFERVFAPAWERRDEIRPRPSDSLSSFANRLRTLNGVSGFMAGQTVADLKYAPQLARANDWWSWAASGPGSRRGLNRMVGRDKLAPWREEDWHAKLLELQGLVNDRFHKSIGSLHAQDLQNCLCEFDKYQRFTTGEGRPKQKFKPRKDIP